MLDQKNKTENVNLGDSINEFIQRNRKAIFFLSCAIVIAFIGVIVFISVKSNIDKKAAVKIEELNTRFDELKNDFAQEDSNEEVDALIADLEAFAAGARGFPGSKAWTLIAEIHSDRKDWALAEEAFINAGRVGEKTYLGPIAYFNAAAAAEEQGRIEEAISLLHQCLSLKIEFPAAPRAQFSIGRLNEQLENYEEALVAYRAVLINFNDTPIWQQLANSRITAIEVNGL